MLTTDPSKLAQYRAGTLTDATYGYVVVDLHTNALTGRFYLSPASARRAVDRLDNAYGGYRYTATPALRLV